MLDLLWWRQLSQQWKHAFAETFFLHDKEPMSNELAQLCTTPAIRFAGPKAPYPNMSFELTDLSGVVRFTNLEVLVVTHHQIQTIGELHSLKKLKSLFLYNNRIQHLEGIEELTALEQLFVQWNRIESIKPIQKLTNLKEFYLHDNALSSFEGLTEAHGEKLETFYGKPNEGIKQKEIIRVEKELYIRCRSL